MYSDLICTRCKKGLGAFPFLLLSDALRQVVLGVDFVVELANRFWNNHYIRQSFEILAVVRRHTFALVLELLDFVARGLPCVHRLVVHRLAFAQFGDVFSLFA